LLLKFFLHSLPGKCDICYEIDTLRRSSQDKETQEQLNIAHHLHRGGMFNLERLKYKRRAAEAIKSNSGPRPTVMSLIIDGMDQSHCKCPYLGSQSTFSKPISQHIVGVKEHGVGVTLFRHFNNVSKSADVTIYCILRKLEEFFERHGYYPEKLYVQADGGSENANKYLLAMLELLVIKRVCRDVYFTRLPVGHTHEDIDAAFAVIWSCFSSEPCETLELYKTRIQEAFVSTALHAHMEDILAVPDYQTILEDCIIPGLAKMHKEEHTQLQWHFFAVAVDSMFPLGCKTTYRAYSSDQVVEFKKQPKGQCISKVGRYTGLEPYTLFCRWYPSSKCDPNRIGVEGFYILKNLPVCPFGFGTIMKPRAFEAGSYEEISKCLLAVHQQWQAFDTHSWIIFEWEKWRSEYAPISDDAVQYVTDRRTKKHYSMPLRLILFNPSQYMTPENWINKVDAYSEYDPNFQWPEKVAIALNSVASDQFNPHPPDPRLYAALDDAIVQRKQHFCDHSVLYYDVKLQEMTVKVLKDMLRRRVGYSGEELSLSGSMWMQLM
jgi:hypothetical protein